MPAATRSALRAGVGKVECPLRGHRPSRPQERPGGFRRGRM